MFALALYNKQENILYLARDRVGENHYIITIKIINLFLAQIFQYLKK